MPLYCTAGGVHEMPSSRLTWACQVRMMQAVAPVFLALSGHCLLTSLKFNILWTHGLRNKEGSMTAMVGQPDFTGRRMVTAYAGAVESRHHELMEHAASLAMNRIGNDSLTWASASASATFRLA